MSAFRFSSRLRELRVHLCQTGESSQGAREFINKHYVSLKQTNPNCPILVRECEGVQPKIWARFDFGKEDLIFLTNKTPDEILKQLQSMVKG